MGNNNNEKKHSKPLKMMNLASCTDKSSRFPHHMLNPAHSMADNPQSNSTFTYPPQGAQEDFTLSNKSGVTFEESN